jgi:hypothetical protein
VHGKEWATEVSGESETEEHFTEETAWSKQWQ